LLVSQANLEKETLAMWFPSVLKSRKFGSVRPRAGRVRVAKTRLGVEMLEDRMLLSYTITPIADTGPGSPYSGLVVGQAINDVGQVAFVADLKSGGEAIYRTGDDGRLTTIAQTNRKIRDFYLSPYMNDSGTVVFGADLTDGTQARMALLCVIHSMDKVCDNSSPVPG
jgi:hypothetical protein